MEPGGGGEELETEVEGALRIRAKEKDKGKEKAKEKDKDKEQDEEEEAEEEEEGEEMRRLAVHSGRIQVLKQGSAANGGGVLYWMSRDQRATDNWALLHAQELARKHKSPLGVLFCLVPGFQGATLRHYSFMIKGLQEVERQLRHLNIPMLLVKGQPAEVIPRTLERHSISHLVCDYSPMRIGRKWKEEVAAATDATVIQVDAHNLVPVWEASDKQEHAARTIRTKIHAKLPDFLQDFPELETQKTKDGSWASEAKPIDWDDVWEFVNTNVDKSVGEVDWLVPGETAAKALLQKFLTTKMKDYVRLRNDPNYDGQSNLSAYLHYGQLSAQRCILEAKKYKAKCAAGYESFLEELVIRRELADNFCHFNDNYDNFNGFPNWAKESLTLHAKDKRQHVFTYDQLDKGLTTDALWNASQLQMVARGKMHGFMRMYWAKKILEWTESPQQAMEFAVKLNDRYELDGRDPNGYVGCAWSIGGVHDQGWAERPVFGKVRYMNYAGCKRKFDVESYIRKYGRKGDEISPTGYASASSSSSSSASSSSASSSVASSSSDSSEASTSGSTTSESDAGGENVRKRTAVAASDKSATTSTAARPAKKTKRTPAAAVPKRGAKRASDQEE